MRAHAQRRGAASHAAPFLMVSLLALDGLVSGCADVRSMPSDETASWTRRSAIPDGDPAGAVLGPLFLPSAAPLYDVGLELDITHEYLGDLEIGLRYEAPDGRRIDIPVELYRARTGGIESPEVWAYPDSLAGRYYFRDDPGAREGEVDRIAAPGTPTFSALDGMPGGGAFHLVVIDHDRGKTGEVRSWTVRRQPPRTRSISRASESSARVTAMRAASVLGLFRRRAISS